MSLNSDGACGAAMRPLFAALITACLCCLSLLPASAAAKHYPCPYTDTVNITEGLRLKDGSYSYEGLRIPANMTAVYDVQVVDGIESDTPLHTRGCACRLKPCITFCCPAEHVFDEQHHSCVPHASPLSAQQQRPQHAHIEVTYANGSVDVVNIRDMFLMRFESGCSKKFIDKRNDQFWKWDLFPNGTLSTMGRLWSTDEYCFTPLEHKKVWSLVPLTCEHSAHGLRLWVYVTCMLLAILINTFTVLLLISIREVRCTGYGESIIFYLASIIVGLGALTYLALKNRLDLSETACRNIGFLAYVFLIFSFLLLGIISWNFWYNFQSKRLPSWKRKVLYLLAIAVAVGLRFLLKLMQDSNVPQFLKPGIGDAFCWFDVRLWGIFLYYYLPIMLLLTLCMFFFIKTYMRIWDLPEDTISMAGYDIKLIKSNFFAFFGYLLGVLCVWTRELVVYLTFRIRGQYYVLDFWTGICMFGLSISALVFLLYKNRLVQSWWRVNVSNETDNDAHLSRVYPSEQARQDKLKEGYKDEIQLEDIALR